MVALKKGIAVFIINKKSILLVKRLIEPFKGYWEVPTGKVEIGESYDEAVIREINEEIGIKIKINKKIGINIDPQNGFEVHMFLVEVFSGKIKNKEPENHAEIKFFAFDALPPNLGGTTLSGLKILNM